MSEGQNGGTFAWSGLIRNKRSGTSSPEKVPLQEPLSFHNDFSSTQYSPSRAF